ELPAHLRISAVAAGCENDTSARLYELTRFHDNTDHPPAVNREARDRLISHYRHAALAQRRHKPADENETLAAHVLPSTLGDKIGIPVRGAVEAAPGDLLLRVTKQGTSCGANTRSHQSP